ncbi:MAG: glycoside hydrolase family 20 zincin-like fold domain-containing protein [Acidobacteria bacterium]|nr:glycoside hydrolase family 20 zincin-like fold domain-containing protein [Acidobacteriota bacterium]
MRTLCGVLLATMAAAAATIQVPSGNDPRIAYAVEQLNAVLPEHSRASVRIVVDPSRAPQTAEGYRLRATGSRVDVSGHDAAGAMYGVLDLARRIQSDRRLPVRLDESAAPGLSLRGVCVSLMKLGTYDYPVTPQEFPWFYDRKLWLEYLDYLAANRFNYIAFWNGHPFDYFVRLPKYPEAQDGMEAGLLEKNHEMLMWLGKEAEKRNIWLMFQFYNIHTSVYFKQAHKAEYRDDMPTPLLADYTGYCIERFVREFPSVGLYICPGERLRLQYTDSWINEVILPAIKRTGKNPPVMIRAWGINLPHMRKVAGNYTPLYTERKFNVEMIASTEIDPENAEWARITGNHVVNIHCLGNLEPFRWSPPSYIQQIIRNSRRAGAQGLHLYPRKFWRWPYGCDRVSTPELQWKRDWMWFEAWARYAWNADLDPAKEREHWIARLADEYGSTAAPHVLASYEAAADVLPAIQRLIWLGYDNHTVVSAGIFLDQLEKAPGIPFLALPGLIRIPRYLEALRAGTKLEGETPAGLLAAKLREAEKAAAEAELASASATRRKADAGRIASDAQAVALVARFYVHKMRAAEARARNDRAQMLASMEASLNDFRELTDLTRRTYESVSDVPLYYPVRFKPVICPYHWSDLLPYMEKELARIKAD